MPIAVCEPLPGELALGGRNARADPTGLVAAGEICTTYGDGKEARALDAEAADNT